MERDRYCTRVSEEDIGKSLCFTGWVQNIRDMGGVIFLDLRDRTGILQVVCDLKYLGIERFSQVEKIRNEDVIGVEGEIRSRNLETYNPKLPTGTIELKVLEIESYSRSKTLPFRVGDRNTREDIRLKHRYLDLRKPSLYKNLQLRHSTLKTIRRFLEDREFLEVETPILTRSTPEGARDYLVPSRVNKGKFYALPQSPQIFKQILMASGIDRYYQVAKCFRDEDLRADRQPEFTQVDMELSFSSREKILNYLEDLFKTIFSNVLGIDIKEKFRRISYKDAIDLYGTDKPDLRFGMEMVDLSEVLKDTDFKVFKDALETGLVKAIKVQGGNLFTRKQVDFLTEKAIDYGSKGMAWIAIEDSGELRSILTKYFKKEEMDGILKAMEAGPGDLIIFSADSIDVVNKTLGNLRQDIASMQGLKNKEDYKFLIVTDFPLFEEGKGRLKSMHHPFTMMHREDIDLLDTSPEKVRALSYDVVLNGVELGSGSIRIHDSELQEKIFRLLEVPEKEIEERFGFLLEAFSYGVPPHGGFAFGLDRLVMLMAGEDSIRDVIAFPKTREGICPLSNAPGDVDMDQLEALDFLKAKKSITSESRQEDEKVNLEALAEDSYIYLREPEEYKEYILDMVEEIKDIKEADVSNHLPIVNISPVENCFREDKASEESGKKEILKYMGEKEGQLIKLEHERS